MTMFIVRSRSRIYGPFYNAQDGVDWAELTRGGIPASEGPLGVELLEDPEVRVPPVQPKAPVDDDDMPF